MTEALSDDELELLREFCGDANTPAVIEDGIREFKEDSVLSDREAEVYVLRGHGFRTPHVANILGLEENTAQEYLRRANRRVDAADRTVELVEDL